MTMKKLGKGCLVIVAGFVVLVILGALLGRPTTPAANGIVATSQISEQNATAVAEQPTAAPKTLAIGDDVFVAEMRWNILAAEDLGDTLKSDNTFIKDLKTSGRFVKIRFEMENRSKDLLSYLGVDLVDSQGRTFKSSSDALQFIPEDEVCILENLNPNIIKTCTVIYEVPGSASGLHAQVTDLKLLGSARELVDLDLTLK
jgi:hypothetical protein